MPIVEDERLNEYSSVENETWVDLQHRVRNCVKDIVNKFNKKDAVICVTSGVNVVALMSLAFKLKPSEDAPYVSIESCSPMTFEIDKDSF